MQVGELFVKLGLQGGDKTLGSLKENQRAFKGTASMALEAKAAILGAAYALQSLFRGSNAVGSDLTNFNATVGVSAQTLQRYQYAARQVGVDNKAVEGSFRSLQSAMTKTLMGEGAPKGLARVAQLTGDLSPEDLIEFSKAPEKLLQRLQEYAGKEKDAGFRNEVLKSFGLGDDIIAALNRRAFTGEALAKASVYNDREVQSLDKANVAWANLGNRIEMAVGRFNAKYGEELVSNLGKITGEVIQLVEAFVQLSDKIKLFELFGDAIRGWVLIFEQLKVLVDYIGEKIPSIGGALAKFVSSVPNVYQQFKEEIDKNYSSAPTLKAMAPSVYDDRYKTDEMIADRNWGDAEKQRERERQRFQEKTPGVAMPEPRRQPEAERPKTPPPVYDERYTREMFADRNWGEAEKKRERERLLLQVKVPGISMPEIVMPKMPVAAKSPAAVNNQTVTVNQTLNFTGANQTDTAEIKRIHGEAVQRALRQFSAQGRSN